MSQNVLDGLPIAALEIDSDHRIVAHNELAQSLVGVPLRGQLHASALRQPDLVGRVDTVLDGGEGGTVTYVVTIAGTEREYEANVAPLSEIDGALVTFIDASAMKEAGQMRSDFVANVSHELRSPLTALTGFIETLRGPARDDEKARNHFLEIMEREAQRMNRLVADLLSLSRVEDMLRVKPEGKVALDKVIQSSISSLEPMASKRGVTFKVGVQSGQPLVVTGDHDQLTQVFMNLLENAVKYGRDGGEVLVDVSSVAHVPAFGGPGVRIAVSDQGEGIGSYHIGRLTERFYRVDDHRSREVGGTGLGLAIVKHIINRHRGRLRIESTPGVGSTFTVQLPING